MRGAETIQEIVKGEVDWQGDPVGEEADPRDIVGCQLWPRTDPDDEMAIIEGWNVFVPPDQEPPVATSTIILPARGAEGDRWSIQGPIGPYDIRSVAKGAIFVITRSYGVAEDDAS